ncbi:MAG: proprotein convertase P-domain-containing protein, partial [Xanthomonadales bacterium]|nr:proprotein convertase P-domain-containing protein [Xanthomonadales bacterium]
PASRSVSVSGANVSGQNFTGTSTTQPSFFENTTNYTINDNSDIYSPITVSGRTGNAPSNLQVSVNIIHTYQGDLQVYLIAPDGSSYTLHNRTGGGTDNLIKTYTVNASSEVANGTWQLRVRDRAAGDTGYLDSWSLQF